MSRQTTVAHLVWWLGRYTASSFCLLLPPLSRVTHGPWSFPLFAVGWGIHPSRGSCSKTWPNLRPTTLSLLFFLCRDQGPNVSKQMPFLSRSLVPARLPVGVKPSCLRPLEKNVRTTGNRRGAFVLSNPGNLGSYSGEPA